jgi:hypothetical protein
MSVLYDEFSNDLKSAISSVEFISCWDSVGNIQENDLNAIKDTETYSLITKIRENMIRLRIDQNIIRGGLILFVVGRFEMYVKQLIEDICKRYVYKAGVFNKLPKALKDNLITYTGMVIQNPRRYGHAENGVKSFISILNSNINGEQPFEKINTECIIITEENMRPETLKGLFERIGAKEVFEKISQQAAVQTFFGSVNSGHVASEIGRTLNKIIDLRNSIAHPVPSFVWPSKEEVISNIEFLIKIGKALDEISDTYVSSLEV